MTEVVVEYDPFTSAAGTSSSSASSIIIDHFGISCHRRPLVGTSRFQFGLNAKTWPSLNDVCSIDVMRTPPFGPSISLSRRRNEASSRCKNYRLFLSFLCVPGALGTAPSLIHNCFSTRQGFEKKKEKEWRWRIDSFLAARVNRSESSLWSLLAPWFQCWKCFRFCPPLPHCQVHPPLCLPHSTQVWGPENTENIIIFMPLTWIVR